MERILHKLNQIDWAFVTPWTLLAALLLGLLAGYASGQTPPLAPGPNGPNGPNTVPGTPPPQMTSADRAAIASQAMQRSGGSLLRASLAAQSDAGQAQLSQVSFFNVPEPEPRTVKKHDLITIIVREESEFTAEGTTEATKEASIDAEITDFIRFQFDPLELKAGGIGDEPPRIRANANREFNGEGTVERTDSLNFRITAEVIDVKPNNTLVLQARKRLKTDDEIQEFILTGICRVEDISADNSVLSTQVHDLDLIKKHEGVVRNTTRKGWAGRILDFLKIF
jgi:flagellar L-ring protein precursor FlgH